MLFSYSIVAFYCKDGVLENDMSSHNYCFFSVNGMSMCHKHGVTKFRIKLKGTPKAFSKHDVYVVL